MSTKIDLYVIRHGQTDANVKGINGGPQVPLNKTGIDQAERLFKSKLLPQTPDIIYCSPHTRTVQTAKLATNRDDIKCEELLVERDFGKWEGAKWDEIFQRTKGTVLGVKKKIKNFSKKIEVFFKKLQNFSKKN